MALAYSLGACFAPDVTCRFNREEGSGSRMDFFVGCPGALAASQACYVTDRWFTHHFSVIARFRIGAWMADVACPIACQPLWPACWMDTPDRSSSSSSRIVQDVWDVYRDVLGVVPDDVVLALRDAVSRSSVNDFWSIWSKNAEAGLFRAYALPYFCKSGHPEVSPDQLLGFIGHCLPQETYLDLPRITGRDLQEVDRAKKATAGGLDGWAWNEIKALPLPWFSGLAFLLELIESTGTWPQGLLDAYIVMIPKVDGDSTLGQRPRSVLPVVYRLWASLRLGHLWSGLREGCLNRCLVSVMVYLRLRPGSLLHWIMRRFFLVLVMISCMLWLLM